MFFVLIGISLTNSLTMKSQSAKRHHFQMSNKLLVPSAVPRRVNAVVTRVFPPIPDQEEKNISLKQQFRPRFVAREFLLGASATCRVFPILMAAYLLTTLAQLTFLSFSSSFTISEPISGPITGPHVWGVKAMRVISKTFGIPLSSMAFENLIGPTIEEVMCRGFTHWLGALVSQWQLCFFCLLCGWTSPVVALVLTNLGEVEMIAKLPLSPQTWARVILTAIRLPAVLAIFKAFRCNGKFSSHQQLVDDVHAIASRSHRIGPLNHNAFIAQTLKRQNCTETDIGRIQQLADRAVSWNARWLGAVYFGWAHLGLAADFSGVQKCAITMIHSLLIESRLAVKRRTLWGAIGAHVAWNSLIDVMPLVKVMAFYEIWFRNVPQPPFFECYSMSLLIAMSFFGNGLLLYYSANFLDRVRTRLLSSKPK